MRQAWPYQGRGGFYVNIPFSTTPSIWRWSHWRLHNTGYPLGTDTMVRKKSHPLQFEVFEVTDFAVSSVGFSLRFLQIPLSRLYLSNHTGSFHLRCGMGKWSSQCFGLRENQSTLLKYVCTSTYVSVPAKASSHSMYTLRLNGLDFYRFIKIISLHILDQILRYVQYQFPINADFTAIDTRLHSLIL